MPEDGQQEPDDDNVPRECLRAEELSNGEEVRDARNRQRNKKRRIAHPAEIARTDEQRYEQNRAEPA